MDFDNLFILIIIFSFIARAIGEAIKGKKAPPPQQRPPQRQRLPGQPGPPPSLPQQRPVPQQRQAPERASDMIPDELWMILTGQPRPPASPPSTEAGEDEELEPDEEAVFQPRTSGEDRQAEDLRRSRAEVADRRAQARDPERPVIVSLEGEPPSPAVRHARFHQKVDQPLQVVAVVDRGRPAPSLARIAGAEPQALRRAIVLQEILGKPKGLE